MSVTSHISRLRERHETLSRIIEEEQRSPASDDLQVSAMKREKLHIKEEIQRLSPG